MRLTDRAIWYLRDKGWIRTAKSVVFFFRFWHVLSNKDTPLAHKWADLEREWREDDWGPKKWAAFFADLPERQTKNSLVSRLREEAMVGMAIKGLSDDSWARQRLNRELADVREAGMAEAFLAVSQTAEWLQDEGVPWGPGRGADCGALLAYVLGITGVNPLVHGLLWERFFAERNQRDPRRRIQIDVSDLCEHEVRAHLGWDEIETQTGRRINPADWGILFMRVPHTIRRAFELLHEAGVECPSSAALPLDDHEVYAILSSGHCENVFQLEDRGAQLGPAHVAAGTLRQLQPSNFQELIAFLSPARHATTQAGIMDTYIAAKHGERPDWNSTVLKAVLAETHGVLVYQEQTMRIAHGLTRMSLCDALHWLRRFADDPATARRHFLDACGKAGCCIDVATSAVDIIERNGHHAVCRAHAVTYGVMTYQTAWLEAKHPQVYGKARKELGVSSVEQE